MNFLRALARNDRENLSGMPLIISIHSFLVGKRWKDTIINFFFSFHGGVRLLERGPQSCPERIKSPEKGGVLCTFRIFPRIPESFSSFIPNLK